MGKWVKWVVRTYKWYTFHYITLHLRSDHVEKGCLIKLGDQGHHQRNMFGGLVVPPFLTHRCQPLPLVIPDTTWSGTFSGVVLTILTTSTHTPLLNS